MVLRYFLYSNRTEHIWGIAHNRARCSHSTWQHMQKTQRELHLSTVTTSAEDATFFVRLWTLLENDPDHRKRSRARGAESSHVYPSFELWENAERCFCFHCPDPFLAALVFIIPGWTQTDRHCQRLTQYVDLKFLHIIVSAILKS